MLAMALLTLVLAATTVVRAPVQSPLAMCSPDHVDPALQCNCLNLHRGWCEEDVPPPNCCKWGEKKAARCGCCLAQRAGSGRWVGKLCSHS